MNKTEEQARFNALGQDDALAILAKYDGAKPVLRSCGYCNGAHEHLMHDFAFMCFACGMWYLDGYPAPAVVVRSNGATVTDEMIDKFAAALEEA
jgi:hypothetical protein